MIEFPHLSWCVALCQADSQKGLVFIQALDIVPEADAVLKIPNPGSQLFYPGRSAFITGRLVQRDLSVSREVQGPFHLELLFPDPLCGGVPSPPA